MGVADIRSLLVVASACIQTDLDLRCQKEQYDSWILFQFAKLQKREYMGNLEQQCLNHVITTLQLRICAAGLQLLSI